MANYYQSSPQCSVQARHIGVVMQGMANTFLELLSVLHSLTNIKQDNKIHR